MLGKLMPVMSLVAGLAGGGTAAVVLAPSAPDAESGHSEIAEVSAEKSSESDHGTESEIVKIPNQFVVPVILNDRVRSMVILTVALEVATGDGDRVRSLEPKLRDTFLDELFNLAAVGGFKDEVITRKTLDIVRTTLTERARVTLGSPGVKVLVTDMARQDVR